MPLSSLVLFVVGETILGLYLHRFLLGQQSIDSAVMKKLGQMNGIDGKWIYTTRSRMELRSWCTWPDNRREKDGLNRAGETLEESFFDLKTSSERN